MLSLRIFVDEVLGLHQVHGSLSEVSDTGRVEVLATFSHSWQLSDAWLEEDQIASMFEVVRQWAERTRLG